MFLLLYFHIHFDYFKLLISIFNFFQIFFSNLAHFVTLCTHCRVHIGHIPWVSEQWTRRRHLMSALPHSPPLPSPTTFSILSYRQCKALIRKSANVISAFSPTLFPSPSLSLLLYTYVCLAPQGG